MRPMRSVRKARSVFDEGSLDQYLRGSAVPVESPGRRVKIGAAHRVGEEEGSKDGRSISLRRSVAKKYQNQGVSLAT